MNDLKAVQKQLWETEQEILDVIDKVCADHGIRYSLAYGSLLGAVRHGGFIPWDDDLDIMMLREDYERFIRIWPSAAPKGYLLETERMYDDYVNTFSKVRKEHTTFLQYEYELNVSHHKGIFVDIFPLDRRAPGMISGQIQFCWFAICLLFNRGYVQEGGRTAAFQKAILAIVPRRCYRRLSNWAGKKSRRWNNHPSCELVSPCTIRDCKRFYPSDLFEYLEKIPFNGRSYYAFCNRDRFLSIRYGDYMELPPMEEREWKHHPFLIDFEHSFEELGIK